MIRNSTLIVLLIGYLLPPMLAQTDKPNPWAGKTEEDMRRIADSLAQAFIIADGHVDLPYRLVTKNFRPTKEFIGIPVESAEGDFDYVRAKKGGLDAPFMSIYIPSSYQETGGAKAFADSLIDMVRTIAEAHPDKFNIATSPRHLTSIKRSGRIALPMGMENGAPIENDLKNVEYFRNRGISYITLTHGKDNQICDSSYDTTGTWNGLSPFGREVIKEMNRVGIMVDISHVSDSAFYQAVRLSRAPCIASHSSARRFTPSFKRNMSDDMIRYLGQRGGVIMINFGSGFLDEKVRRNEEKKRAELMELLDKKGLTYRDSAAQPIIENFRNANPSLYANVERVVDHIDHVVRIAGINHVGFGSDFDGVGDSLPTGLKDVSQYPNVIYELMKRGYSAPDIEKICSGNLIRVWQEVEAMSRRLNVKKSKP